MRLLLLCFLSLYTAALAAQVVYTDPTFPTDADEVTIFFDATQGTKGLEDCGCDVYIHTGVITENSTSPSDWKYVQTQWGVAEDDWKLEPVAGQDNLYSFTVSPSVREYYGVPDGESIESISMVFRNADGTLEGKDIGGTDIYAPIYEAGGALQINFSSPGSQFLAVELGEVINVTANASNPADLALYDNGTLLTTVTDATTLDYDLTVSTGGNHLVEMIADADGVLDTISFQYVVVADNVAAAPAGTEPGITYLSDTEVRLALVAPLKNNVFLLGSFNDYTLDADFQLNRDPNGELYWIEVDGLTAGEDYTYQYLVDGDLLIADPYSEVVLDPFNDQFISDETYPNLPAYPNGQTQGRVTLLQPGRTAYDWQVDDFERPADKDLVIYELLLRDFLEAHDYQTLIDTLDYLDDLGINAIELMPVNEFEGNISWGYNPSYHMALDKYYGTIDDFKMLVDAAHARGMAIILDVVYNHAFSQNPYVQLYFDGATFSPTAESPYFNVEATHAFNVGYDFNHESPYTVDYVNRVMRYWLEEFRVDGFRFDLTKGFTQNENGPFDAGAYDASRIAILKNYADVVWDAAGDDAYVILEHFAADSEEQELTDYGALTWGGFNPHDEYLEASMGYNSNFSRADYRTRGFDEPKAVVYMESHDEQRMVYKNQQFGASSGDYDVRDFETSLARAELAAAFFYTIPGPKMLWQFGELGYDFPINYCPNGTVDPGCRTDPKPIRWDYFQTEERRELYLVHKALIDLKLQNEVFCTDDFTLETAAKLKSIHLNGSDMDVVVLGNFDVTTGSIDPAFQSTGDWYEYFSGETLSVTDVNAAIELAPGEYRIYTTAPLDQPQLTSTTALSTVSAFAVTPNPARAGGSTQVQFTVASADALQLTVIDALGRSVLVRPLGRLVGGTYTQSITLPAAGVYRVQLIGARGQSSRSVVVLE